MLEKIFANRKTLYYVAKENLKMENAHLVLETIQSEGQEIAGKNVFLDLSEIDYIDSSGIGIIIKTEEFLKSTGSRLIVVGVNKSIRTIFKLSGLAKILFLIEKTELKNYLTEEEIRLLSDR